MSVSCFTTMSMLALVLPTAVVTPVSAAAAPEICRSSNTEHLRLEQNLHASELLVKCGVLKGGSPKLSASRAAVSPFSFPGSDVNLITGPDTYPRVTQSESFVWSKRDPSGSSTIVVAYNDARGDTDIPPNFSGVSVSHDSGATFTRLGPPSPLTGHGANWGDPVVVYNQKLETWFAGDLVGGCGGQGIGLWTSKDADNWTVGACAHNGEDDDRESMWVDNNPASPFYGRMYISFNDFAQIGSLEITHSDNGTNWTTPVVATVGFVRDIQLTGSPGPDGKVFLAGQIENNGAPVRVGSPIQSYMYRSTNGGASWTKSIMGPSFTVPGKSGCNGIYEPRIPPIWRQTGYGQPAVGPNGVVHYVYASIGEFDEADVYYIRSTNNGTTWEKPVRLYIDPFSHQQAQWMPSLRVTKEGVVEASWYDRRNTTDGLNYQRFARVSTNNGASWGPAEPLTGLIPQPAQPDPLIAACYSGDYNYANTMPSVSNEYGLDTWTDGRIPVNSISTQKVFFHAIPLP